MMSLCCDVLTTLQGKTLATAESLTGGGIGAAITAVSGSSQVYKGGIISYTDSVKEQLLGVPCGVLQTCGAVSAQTAEYMARGVREKLGADVAVSVTGLAGPGGDEFGHPVGTVFIGYNSKMVSCVKECHFSGSREDVRNQTIREALTMILQYNA